MTRLILAAALLVGACGDNIKGTPPGEAGPDDAPVADAGPEALAPCLDRPTDLPRPPDGVLPCELLPPGFTATTGP